MDQAGNLVDGEGRFVQGMCQVNQSKQLQVS